MTGKRSFVEAAKILNTTVTRIKRILSIAKEKGPAALKETSWGKGRW